MEPIDVQYMFNKPPDYVLPPAGQYSNDTQFPHLNSQDYAGRPEDRTLRLHECWDCLSISSNGEELALATNKRDGREWRGAFFGYRSADTTELNLQNANFGLQRPALITQLQHGVENSLYVALANGALEYWCTAAALAPDNVIPRCVLLSAQRAHNAPIGQLAVWSCNQTRAATICLERQLNVWEANASELTEVYAANTIHASKITGLATAPHSVDELAFCAQDGIVQLWDLRLERPASLLHEHDAACFTCMAWHDDDNSIYVGDIDGYVHTLDKRMPRQAAVERQQYFTDSEVTKLCTTTNKLAAIGNRPAMLKIIDLLATREVLYKHSADGQQQRITDAVWRTPEELLTIGYAQKLLVHAVK